MPPSHNEPNQGNLTVHKHFLMPRRVFVYIITNENNNINGRGQNILMMIALKVSGSTLTDAAR